MKDHSEFFRFVEKYVEDNPEVAPFVTEYVSQGLKRSLDLALERAADMEVCVVALLARQNKQMKELPRQKLEKWSGKTSLKWDWFLNSGEEK